MWVPQFGQEGEIVAAYMNLSNWQVRVEGYAIYILGVTQFKVIPSPEEALGEEYFA